jgi:hypothetical protein
MAKNVIDLKNVMFFEGDFIPLDFGLTFLTRIEAEK